VTDIFTDPRPWPASAAPDPQFCGEEERLATLASYSLNEMSGDGELVRLARFAAHLCAAPSAAVTVVEAERQVFLASEGVDASETPRSTSICAHAMKAGEVLVVPDASADPRFADFSLVTGDEHLRFYAGAPLISPEGAPMGALCVLDTVTRPEGLNEVQREGLLVLADAVKRRLLANRQANEVNNALRSSAQRLKFMIDSVPDIAWSAGPGAQFDYFNARWRKTTGLAPPKHVEDWRAVFHPGDFETSRAKFLQAIQKTQSFEDQWRMRQADGTYRWVLSRAVPSTDDPETARWFGTLTDIDDAYRASQERELLAGELAHRIKNIFSVVLALIALHARGEASHQVFAKGLSDTIRALSRAQDFTLRSGQLEAHNLKEMLAALLQPYGAPGTEAVVIEGDAVTFGPNAATPLGLVFHEMATNSAKYGSLSEVGGTVCVTIASSEDEAIITWRETGEPISEEPSETGFGSRLIATVITNQLGGSLEKTWQQEGLCARITLPLARLAH